jgi:hypothetical protein
MQRVADSDSFDTYRMLNRGNQFEELTQIVLPIPVDLTREIVFETEDANSWRIMYKASQVNRTNH